MGECKRENNREVYYDEGPFTRTILIALPLVFPAVPPNAISSVNSFVINVVPTNCLLVINPVTNVMTVTNVTFSIHNMIAVNTTLPETVFQDFSPVPGLALDPISLSKLTTDFDFPSNAKSNASCEIVDIIPTPSFTIVSPDTVQETLTINFKVLIVAPENSMVTLCRNNAAATITT